MWAFIPPKNVSKITVINKFYFYNSLLSRYSILFCAIIICQEILYSTSHLFTFSLNLIVLKPFQHSTNMKTTEIWQISVNNRIIELKTLWQKWKLLIKSLFLFLQQCFKVSSAADTSQCVCQGRNSL